MFTWETERFPDSYSFLNDTNLIMRTPPTRLNLILIIFQMPHVQYYHLRVYGIKICILEGHKLSVQNISIYNFNRMFLLRVYLLHVLWKEHSTSKINKPYSWTSVSETPVIHVVYLCPGPNLNESLELLQLAFSLFSFFSVFEVDISFF